MARLYDRQEQYMKTKTATMPLKWSAPEALSEKKMSYASDMWSFGIVCIGKKLRQMKNMFIYFFEQKFSREIFHTLINLQWKRHSQS